MRVRVRHALLDKNQMRVHGANATREGLLITKLDPTEIKLEPGANKDVQLERFRAAHIRLSSILREVMDKIQRMGIQVDPK